MTRRLIIKKRLTMQRRLERNESRRAVIRDRDRGYLLVNAILEKSLSFPGLSNDGRTDVIVRGVMQ
ncbi:MAG TPA: hypothetical protein VJ372_07855 [Pyrinomonadaceae bacterium]|nr:hypothetical protein [Pyrinomonadaceae bacterium]